MGIMYRCRKSNAFKLSRKTHQSKNIRKCSSHTCLCGVFYMLCLFTNQYTFTIIFKHVTMTSTGIQISVFCFIWLGENHVYLFKCIQCIGLYLFDSFIFISASCINQQTSGIDSKFSIDPNTGVLSVAQRLDFETQSFFPLTVEARVKSTYLLSSGIFH